MYFCFGIAHKLEPSIISSFVPYTPYLSYSLAVADLLPEDGMNYCEAGFKTKATEEVISNHDHITNKIPHQKELDSSLICSGT